MANAEPQLNSAWKRVWQRFKNHYHEFAEETSIDTFVIIDKAKFLLEILVWILATLALLGATVWSVTNTVKAYTSYKTVSTILVDVQTQMKYENISVCFVRNTGSADETVTRFSSLNVHLNSATFVGLLQAEHKRLENVTDNFAKNCKNVECWKDDYHKLLVQLNFPLLSNGQLQFAWLIARLFNEVENNFFSTEKDLEPLNQLINDYKDLWQTINEQISISDIRRMVASIICYKMGIFTSDRYHYFRNRTKWNSFAVKNPCSIENIWWSGTTLNDNETEFICVRIDTQRWLSFNRDTKKQAYLVYTIPNKVDLNLSNSAFDEVQLLFDNELYPTFGDPNILPLQQSASTAVLIEHVGKYSKYEASGKCTPKTAASVCAANRSDVLFRSYCNCATTSRHRLSPVNKIPECSMQNYFDTQENITTVKQCVKEVYSDFTFWNKPSCLPQCNYDVYRYDVQHSDQNFLTHNGTTVVELKSKSFVLYNVEEKLAMDEVQLLSDLGGSLSLWINASFVGILHVAAFVIRKIFVCLRGSCKHESSQNQSASALVDSVSNVDLTNGNADRSVSIMIEINGGSVQQEVPSNTHV